MHTRTHTLTVAQALATWVYLNTIWCIHAELREFNTRSSSNAIGIAITLLSHALFVTLSSSPHSADAPHRPHQSFDANFVCLRTNNAKTHSEISVVLLLTIWHIRGTHTTLTYSTCIYIHLWTWMKTCSNSNTHTRTHWCAAYLIKNKGTIPYTPEIEEKRHKRDTIRNDYVMAVIIMTI